MRLFAAMFMGFAVLLPAFAAQPLHDGDLVFQTSRSGQSLAVQRATHSPWSHMGIVVMRGDKPFVSKPAPPCAIRHSPRGRRTATAAPMRFDA